MNPSDIFALSLDALRERKVRTALTTLMVVVGSSLMVALNGRGAGFGEFIDQQFSMLAPNVLFVFSAPIEEEGMLFQTQAPKITLNAAVMSRLRSLPYVDDVFPAYESRVRIQSAGDVKSANVMSMDPQKLSVLTPTLEYVEGTVVTSSDPSAIYFGNDVANPPGRSTPFVLLGQAVRVTYSFVDPVTGERDEESRTFVVRGIAKPAGSTIVDGTVVINADAGNALLHKGGKYDQLFVAAHSVDYMDAVEQEIRGLYGSDIGVTTSEAILQTIRTFTAGFGVFILSIALVALLVGAVGIITTLYTSFMERTREIGTMKAVGAQSTTVLFLFLSEALMMGVIGATVGLLAGIGEGYILTAGFSLGYEGFPALAPIFLAADLGTVWLISVGLSMAAGLYPAWRAARMSPMMALRKE